MSTHRAFLPSLFILLAACEAGGLRGEAGSGGETGAGGSTSAPSGGGDDGQGGDASGDGGAGNTGNSGNTGPGANSSSSVAVTVGTGTGSGGGDQVAEVFAHSADTLYRLDLETNGITPVGPFVGCNDSVIDIALDRESQMYGTTFGGLWRIDRTTAVCTLVAEGDFPNSLSFVPQGTLDADQEALVGYVNADYVRIDTTSGQVTMVNEGALPGDLISSGDVVSVIDGPTLLTVKGGSCGDCVIEIDPATGASIADLGPATYQSVFGIAFWDGKLYGFTNFGEVFEFFESGGAIQTNPIPIPGGVSSFYGAGSTTAAPPGVIN